jgi:hypothetical protein
MRIVSVFGMSLVLIWALSPVGGQASLRQMTIGTSDTTRNVVFEYLVHNGYTKGFMTPDRESY